MRNRTANQVKGIFIRHGSTASNREHRYLGKTDEPLDEAGIRQLRQGISSGAYTFPETGKRRVYVSPLCRCIQTAHLLYPDTALQVVDAFSEMDFGAFEQKSYEQLSTDPRYRKDYQAWIDSGGVLPFPGGEDRDAFVKRCVSGFEQVIKATEPGSTNVFVVHGGTIMAIFSHYCMGGYYEYQVKNGCGYQCDIEETQDGYRFLNIEAITI